MFLGHNDQVDEFLRMMFVRVVFTRCNYPFRRSEVGGQTLVGQRHTLL